jgi:hypothetical protein
MIHRCARALIGPAADIFESQVETHAGIGDFAVQDLPARVGTSAVASVYF